jgi:hypothetical protein
MELLRGKFNTIFNTIDLKVKINKAAEESDLD